MKGKTAKTAIFLIMVIALLLGCKDAFHDKDDSAPVIPDGNKYTVSYDRNGGSGTVPDPQTAFSADKIIIKSAGDLSKDKYIFGSWNTLASGKGTAYFPGDEFTVPRDNVTLYAKWEPVGSSTVSVNSVTINKPSLSLTTGGSETLTATVSPSNATNKNVKWSSSNPSVATVTESGGTVTAVSAGTATITVTTVDGGRTDTCSLTVSSGSSSGGIDSETGLANKLAWIKRNPQSGGNYIIEVSADEYIGLQELSYSGMSNITITLKGIGSNRTISLSSIGSMFKVCSGVTLVLDKNITLQGRSGNTNALVWVDPGTLIMNSGSSISGNSYMPGYGGGVWVGDPGGTFIMNGGTISGNDAMYGGGVYIATPGTFIMNGGTISNNTATYGGGVAVLHGTFTMKNGTISGNSATDKGGGVFGYSSGAVFNNNYPSGIKGNTPDDVNIYSF